MALSKTFSFLFILLLISCSSDSDVKSRFLQKNDSPKVAKKSADSCLEKYAMNPCELLDLKKVAAIANVEESALELKQPDDRYKKSSMRVCKYTWSTGRKTKTQVGDRMMEFDASNDILVGMFKILNSEKSRIKAPYSDWFKNSHRPMTEEELKSLRESASKKLAESADADANVGMLLLDGMLDIGKKDVYIDVEGLGDLASARISGMSPDIYLDILHGNLTFRIVVNVSNNKTDNFELAKKVGAEIMSLCD